MMNRLTRVIRRQDCQETDLDISIVILTNRPQSFCFAMNLRVKFIGAVGTVTGSCSLLHYKRSDSFYLIDCGLYQGFPGADERNRRKWPFDPARLSAVFLTHAHIDHCGLLPRLVGGGFKGKILCMRATAQFTMNLLRNSVNLGGQPYSRSDVSAVEEMFQCPDDKDEFRFGWQYPLEDDFFFSFIRTAHIVGSVGVQFRENISPAENRTILFAGDVGTCVDGQAHGGLQKALQFPSPKTDFLVCEATYGDRSRNPEMADGKHRISALSKVLTKAIARGPTPTIIIPAFSMQRTQDLVADLFAVFHSLPPKMSSSQLPHVYVDSELAKAQTDVMLKEFSRIDARGKRRFLNSDSLLFMDVEESEIDQRLAMIFETDSSDQFIESGKMAWKLSYGKAEKRSSDVLKIIIASAGNCLGGPVVNYLDANLENQQATVIFTGYVPPGSFGNSIKSLASLAPEKRDSIDIRLGTKEFKGKDVAMGVEDLSGFYSGHADDIGLLRFILWNDTNKPTSPMTVFLVHGDPKARKALRSRIEEAASSGKVDFRQLKAVYLPEPTDGWFDLGSESWVQEKDLTELEARVDELSALMKEIRASQDAILAHLKLRP